jgi:hypothetical protein
MAYSVPLPAAHRGQREKLPHIRRLQVKIPRSLQTEPVLSRLVSDYGLVVNFHGAWLGSNGREDGWFDLLLEGSKSDVEAGLAYLRQQGVEFWTEFPPEGW